MNSGVIFAVVLINAIIGFLQEAKAANAIECLSRIVTMQTTVRRGRQKERVASERLVPGDIVLLQPGDHVGTDLRLFGVKELHVDEFSITGESVPVVKHPDPLVLNAVLSRNARSTAPKTRSDPGS